MSRVLTHGELFAGVSGFGLGFARAGIETLWHVEIDPKCQQVLRHHYPDTLLLDDVTKCGTHNLPPVDIISFGTPCQDLSIAGKRAGLEGERSGLFFEGIRIVDELQPTFAVWENVTGAFSSNAGRDFATVLASFRECGARDIAWRVLDAQYLRVAQRRRRVFVVGDFRAERAAEILFESSRCMWNPETSREARQGVAAPLTRGSAIGNGVNAPGRRQEDDVNLIARSLNAHHAHRYDGESDTFVMEIHGGSKRKDRPDGGFYVREMSTSKPLDTGGLNPNCQQGGIAIAYGFSQESDGSTVRNAENLARPVIGRHGDPGVVAFAQNTRDEVRLLGGDGKIAGALSAQPGIKQQTCMSGQLGVRRLMPIECERLQGFPDGHTDIDGMSDSARYRVLGNAVCVNVSEWIGRCIIEAVDRTTRTC